MRCLSCTVRRNPDSYYSCTYMQKFLKGLFFYKKANETNEVNEVDEVDAVTGISEVYLCNKWSSNT